MPTTLFTWELIVECSVTQDYLESQPRYSADRLSDNSLILKQVQPATKTGMRVHGYDKLIKYVDL